MQNKNIFSVVIIVLAIAIYYFFSVPFNERAVVPLSGEYTNLRDAFDRFSTKISLDNLRKQKQNLSELENRILGTFIPENLHSGKFVYNISQTVIQNRLTIRNVQFSILETNSPKEGSTKKLSVELQFEGQYENFVSWIGLLEKADILVDIESIKMVRISNNSDTLMFTVKLSAYGINIE